MVLTVKLLIEKTYTDTLAKVMTPEGLAEAFKILAGVLQYTIYYKLIQYMLLYTIYNILHHEGCSGQERSNIWITR